MSTSINKKSHEHHEFLPKGHISSEEIRESVDRPLNALPEHDLPAVFDSDVARALREIRSYHWALNWKLPNEILQDMGYPRSRHCC